MASCKADIFFADKGDQISKLRKVTLCLKNCQCDAVKRLQQDETCFNRAKRKIIDMGNGNEMRPKDVSLYIRALAAWICSLWYWQLSFDYRNSSF